MSMTIWKFPLEITTEQVLEVPGGATALSVHTQQGMPCLWAHVDPKAPKVPLRILIFGTGHPADLPPGAKFLGTLVCMSDTLVWHVFTWE